MNEAHATDPFFLGESSPVRQLLMRYVFKGKWFQDQHRMELEVDDDVLVRLLAYVADRRDFLGRTEPYWSILTSPQFKRAAIAPGKDDFYQTGADDVILLRDAVKRCGLSLPWYGTCFELGCGVGRVIPSLRSLFDQVAALDISPAHLALAHDLVKRRCYTNVSLHRASCIDALKQLPQFDCFFSMIALQSNPPPVINWLLRETLQRLRRGGIGFFQLPISTRRSTFISRDYLAHPPPRGQIEVHGLPQEAVIALLHATGCELVEVREHDCVGPYPDWISKTFLIRKAWYKE
jgi:SAM-dependent methyltransferase